jgi:hypothetical protein
MVDFRLGWRYKMKRFLVELVLDNRIGQRSLYSLNRGEEVVGSLHGSQIEGDA